MSDPLKLLIDLDQADLDLNRAELEDFLLTLADEMQRGRLVQEAVLLREEDLPEGAKSGVSAFIMGVLLTEVSLENFKKVVNWLGNRFYGKTLTYSYEDADGTTVAFEYRNDKEFERALQGTERLSRMRLKLTISSKD